jgi:hypothetical protein
MKKNTLFVIYLFCCMVLTAQGTYYLNNSNGETLEVAASDVEKVTSRQIYLTYPIDEYKGFSFEWEKDSLDDYATRMDESTYKVEAESLGWSAGNYVIKVIQSGVSYQLVNGGYLIRGTKGSTFTDVSGSRFVEINGGAKTTIRNLAAGSYYRITPVFVPNFFTPSLVVVNLSDTYYPIPSGSDAVVKVSSNSISKGITSEWILSDGSLNINLYNAAFDSLLSENHYSKNFMVDYFIIERKDSTPAGQSTIKLPDLIQKNESVSIFTELMKLTGWDKKMQDYIDDSYSIGADSLDFKLTYTSGSTTRQADYPAYRRYYYTGFIEPDNVYIKSGVNSAQEVISKLKSKSGIFAMYDPNNRYSYDENYTDSTNVVYRFVAYHFLNRLGNYADWTVGSAIREARAKHEYLDPQEFYETMCPNTIMKFQYSTGGGTVGLYINRRRVNEGANADRDASNVYSAAIPGVRVWTPTEMSTVEQSALNGVYHYVDNILVLNEAAADALNTRIRMDGGTLSPDFMNDPCSDGLVGKNRTDAKDGKDMCVTLYKPGFIKNFTLSTQTRFGLRLDPVGWSPYYQCSSLDFLGNYDFTVKLPPVPEGTYEIRLGTHTSPSRGIVQFYVDDQPAGIPVDLRIYATDPRIGWQADTEDAETDLINDLDMYNKGYMKGPDSWYIDYSRTNTMRAYSISLRIIIATKYFTEGESHFLRVKSLMNDAKGEFFLDYLELCPKSVYDSSDGEDRH